MTTRARSLLSRTIALLLLLLLGVQMVTKAAASELAAIATLTSQYIYRGQAMSDGDPAGQLGVDYQHDSGVFAGAWASTIDRQSSFGERDIELDYYGGYHVAPNDAIAFTLTLLRYTYPGQTGARSYDYNEALATATLYQRYSIELGYSNDFYGLGWRARHWELRAEWPIIGAWVMGAGVGGNDLTDAGGSHYLYGDFGASTRWSRFILDLRWHDNQTPGGFARSSSAGSEFVISLSAAF